jgi:catechol 2,3-dioxygenase-like lactoylglutathione lyase family enzyme
MTLISNGRGGWRDADETPAIIAGTMVTSDLERARRFYEDYLRFECVQHKPGKLLVRDKRAAEMMRRGERGAFVIEVEEVADIQHPQKMNHHWGFDVESIEEVDRMRKIALDNGKEYGIKRTVPITKTHGSYQFYFSDMDDNWWEIEYRVHGRPNESFIEGGDFERREEPAVNQE